MSPLPFPTAEPVMTLLFSFHEEEAATYAASKHLPPKSWMWLKDVSTFDGLGVVHIEYIGMHWRKRKDVKEIHEKFEEKRAAGETR